VVLMDVTSVESVQRARQEVTTMLLEAKGHLVAVVNNAGYSAPGRILAMPIGLWKKQYNVNVFGLVAVTQAFFPLLRQAAREGLSPRVIYISSVIGEVSLAEAAVYCSSKFAVQAIADSSRIEFATEGVKTVVIQPGAFKTEFFSKLLTAYEAANEAEEGNEIIDEESRRTALAASSRSVAFLSSMNDALPPPDPVAGALETSVLARMPEAKVFVGNDVGIFYLLSTVPDEISDWVKYLTFILPNYDSIFSLLVRQKQKNE